MINKEQLDLLYKLKKEVEKSRNEALLHTINQVIKKVYLQQYTCSFVGHFSAGKSTLINLLIEQDILPSSPVPTTSNTAIVSVSDNHDIIANLPNQTYAKLSNYDEVREMNRQNVDVESVEINFQSAKFENGFTLQDTPGVDSNVASHQSITEQYMYTSNMIFYTVDYNHVQSELNFKFMKHINDVGIPVVFIINQIDKHQDDELSFSTFKSRVEKSIADWGIKLERTFYVSKFDHPENELEVLSSYLISLDQHRETIEDYTSRTVEYITEAQLDYIQSEIQEVLEDLGIEEAEFEQAFLNSQQHQAISEEAQLLNNPDELMAFLKNKRKNILENAYIMPHNMREMLRSYLESMSQDFNVGGFFNKKKKKLQIQQQRLLTATDALQEHVNQQIRQPMREDMSFVTRFINKKEASDKVLNQHYDVKPEMIEGLYQPQTSISNTYVLTFSDEVVKAIKKYVEQQSTPIFKEIIENVQADELPTEESDDLKEYQRYTELNELRQSLTTKNYRHYYIHLDESLDKLIGRQETTYQLATDNARDNRDNQQLNQNTATTNMSIDIQKALDIISDVPLFKRTKQDIHETLTRIDNKLIKIGVFGTFSAGKSSLINALLGEHILVSSPNPTTAATTEISYRDESYITLKSQSQLLDEINAVVEYQDMSYSTIEEFINSDLEKLKSHLNKNQLAFIQAVEKHYKLYVNMLENGEKHAINQQELKKWSAEDEYATFVKTVHIALMHDWLKGKIIVDSLGLHSNNQRHTNETEQILTSSDLILYVSYFNHSFTDNDKSFIEHMKDMNQLNENQAFKMVINAADLAESQDDLEAVETYVSDALRQVNLQSDIFAVSSRNALQAEDKGIDQLKQSIQQFVDVESKSILEQQMIHQLQQMDRSYVEMVTEFETNKADITRRQQRLTVYKDKQRLQHQLIDATLQHTDNEVEEQVYHLNARLKLQLLDDVKSVFNSQMTQNSDFNEEKKVSTRVYLDQIHQRLFLEQSLITERIKKYFNKKLTEQIAPIVQQLADLHVIVNPQFNFESANIEQPLLHIDFNDMLNALPKQLTKRKILNPNGQRDIHESICQSTLGLLQPQMGLLREQLELYVKQMAVEAESQFESFEANIQTQINDLLAFDLDTTLINQLKDKHQQLKTILY
ncbi:TPA: dynamin family protein [Staphylococcus aureus]|uniref:dynamin family protein n=1 Tax=Staphylococcus aureus TaxID=1280 RepID=UPI0004F33009|nr:dynamin family protein [Staphylococcus aureus]OWT00870.1 dynamin family protein [Staphylococcus aureus]UZZ95216.1 dynamin family protein [Staphylococcus aureus]HDE5422295.1 dynamin family protein [Staphylococcus aureus]HDE8395061.1 dynamin family protein [Staphylococcus aureus]HDE8741622.1 dynamin family protein [Staphylococcus aureus]